MVFLAGIVRDDDCGLRERLRAADQATKMEGWYAQKRTIEHINTGGPSITISLDEAKKLVRGQHAELKEAYEAEFIDLSPKGLEGVRLEEEPRGGLGPGGDDGPDARSEQVRGEAEEPGHPGQPRGLD